MSKVIPEGKQAASLQDAAVKPAPAPAPDPSSEVTQANLGKLRPRRIVPGVVGRSAWFAERAGRRPNALTMDRLRAALDVAQDHPDAAHPEAAVDERALEALDRSGLRSKGVAAPMVIDDHGCVMDLKLVEGPSPAAASAIGAPIRVPGLRAPATLVIPVDKGVHAYLDLEEVVAAEKSDPRHSRLLDSFRYLPELGAVVGRISQGGIYQAFALPKHPWLRHTYEILARNWKWVALDPAIRKLGKGATQPRIGFVDRICQLILCASDYRAIGDPRIFGRGGVALPPGFEGEGGFGGDHGLPPGIGGGGNLCERCIGGFLGEIDVIDGFVIPPPLVKWWWHRHPRCTGWSSIGPFPVAGFSGVGRVTQLAVHPTNGDVLIAGAAGGGVWRTDNGGTTWRALMSQQPTLTMGAVAIAPSNPQVMYAASGEDGGGWDPAWGGVGLYRSSDGGAHWTLMTALPSTRFSAIVVDPTDPDTLYAAGNTGLHKSDDGGATWIVNPGLGSLFAGQVTDVVIAHDDPDRIYIGVAGNGVFRSTTGGEQVGATPAFTRLDGADQLPSGGAAGWAKLAIGRAGASGSNFLAAKMGPDGSRIFRTTDGGTTWTELAANVTTVAYDEWCSVIAVDPTDQNVLYAGAAGQLLRTTNGGMNAGDWTAINAGVHPDQQDICFDPNNASRIFLANDGGVYRSANRGDTWELASGNLAITQFYDIDIAERDKDIVAGGAQDNGVYYRNDTGVWRNIPWGDGTQVAIDQTDPTILYFSAQNGLPTWLRRSVDGGVTHQQLNQSGLSGGSPWITLIKLDPTDPIANPATSRILFVCGTNQLFRSTSGGQSPWQRVNDVAGNAFTTNGTITALEFAPSDTSVLYLGTSSGALYRGVNGGIAAVDWTRIDTVGSSADMLFPNSQIQALRVNPLDANDVWVVFGGAGVSFTGRPGMILNPLGISHLFRSTDGGTTWVDASGRFAPMSLPDVPTSAVAISDVDRDLAYVGTDVGVFRTTDGGVTWSAFQDGLPRSPVVELRYNRRFDRIFAGTMGRGVFVRDV